MQVSAILYWLILIPFFFGWSTCNAESNFTTEAIFTHRNEDFVQEPTFLNTIDKWSITKFNVVKQVFSWTIINFSFNGKKQDEYIESPILDSPNSDYKWRLKLYPNGYYHEEIKLEPLYPVEENQDYNEEIRPVMHPIKSIIGSREHLSIHLSLESDSNIIGITSKLSLLKSNNELYSPKYPYVGAISTVNNSDVNDYYNTFVRKDYVMNAKNNFLPDNKLTIILEITSKVNETNSVKSCGSPIDVSNDVHIDNFEMLLEDELFSDVTFKVNNNGEFKAHKAILATVSPVFLDEFKNMQPNKTTIEVDNVETKAFKELLRYAYTGKVEKIEKNAKKLLPLAEKYNVTRLKSICERALCQDLTADNAMDLLQLATNANATYLKVQALKYITMHAQNMIDTPSFVSLISEPQNLVSVIRALVNKS